MPPSQIATKGPATLERANHRRRIDFPRNGSAAQPDHAQSAKPESISAQDRLGQPVYAGSTIYDPNGGDSVGGIVVAVSGNELLYQSTVARDGKTGCILAATSDEVTVQASIALVDLADLPDVQPRPESEAGHDD